MMSRGLFVLLLTLAVIGSGYCRASKESHEKSPEKGKAKIQRWREIIRKICTPPKMSENKLKELEACYAHDPIRSNKIVLACEALIYGPTLEEKRKGFCKMIRLPRDKRREERRKMKACVIEGIKKDPEEGKKLTDLKEKLAAMDKKERRHLILKWAHERRRCLERVLDEESNVVYAADDKIF